VPFSYHAHGLSSSQAAASPAASIIIHCVVVTY
jgi:hypothetical protein